MTDIAIDRISALRAALQGDVLTPDDDGYNEARSIWNGAIDKRPALIARCATNSDVAAAIRFARESSLEISIRGGGHNYAGFALSDGGLTIDLTRMRSIVVDPVGRRATCGGGTTWAELDAACQAHGLAVPGGFISHTGVAGLTLGGGLGWLTRKAGLSCDNLVGAEVVTADGEIVRASDTDNPDLFWAIRGGGGNFGVVTSFEFRLHEVPPVVQLGLFFWGLDQGREVLTLGREFSRDLPRDLNAFIGGIYAPPEPFVPEQYRLVPGYALIVVGFTDAETHAARIAPIRSALPPLFELVAPIPYVALQQMFDASAPWGVLAYEKAVYLDELSDGAISVITEHMPRMSSPLSIVPIFALAGAYEDTADDAVAFGGRRSNRWVVNLSAGAETPEALAAEREWVRNFWTALVPHAAGVGSYVNFMAEYEEDRVRAAYGPAKYARLSAIKAKWDPDNLFHLNANIRPG